MRWCADLHRQHEKKLPVAWYSDIVGINLEHSELRHRFVQGNDGLRGRVEVAPVRALDVFA